MSLGVKGTARLLIAAGAAKPSPSLGQALGPLGVNMAEFCKQANAKTAHMKPNVQVRARVTAFEDRSFTFVLAGPSNSWLLKRVTGVTKGANSPGKDKPVGSVSVRAIYEIAKAKQTHDPRMSSLTLEAIAKCVAGSAKSMGLKLVK